MGDMSEGTGQEGQQRWRRVLESARLEEGQGRHVRWPAGAGPVEIALFRVGGKVHAIENRCPHQGAALHDGVLEGHLLRCRWHGWPFDVRTGRPPVGAHPCVRTARVRERDGWIWVCVGPDGDPFRRPGA